MYLYEEMTYKQFLNELIGKLNQEKSYDRIFSSMCTPPLEVLREIASEFAEINLGDPGLFPESVKLEREVLEEYANILHAPNTWTGSITSGGSESNLIGCWAARNWGWKKKNIKNGKIIFPKSAHVSFEKASDILAIKSDWIDLDEDFRVNIESVKNSIDHETVGLVGIAGTTGTGVSDDIIALSDLAIDHNLYLHVDAAHGGMIYPFLVELDYPSHQFDFLLEGVSSITIDSHKILGSIIPGGNILFRSNEYSEAIEKTISYLSNSSTKQMTITGTRPGNATLCAWVLLKKLGRSYIIERVKYCLDLTKYFVEQLKQIPKIDLVFEPTINIIGFKNSVMSTKDLMAKLREFGWKVSIFSDWARIVVMPHITKPNIDLFINDLENILNDKKE
ncbi:MAG: tyrosine decarboxylase MfnA [Candidatus Thorarchaeota archaeon]